LLGFLLEVGADPAQIPNNASYKTGVGIENLDTTFTLDVCDDPGFPPTFVYKLDPGQWYSYSGVGSFWCRITPGQPNLQAGYNVTVWVNPGGAANIGGQIVPNTGAQAVNIAGPNPLPVQVVTPATQVNVGPPVNPIPPGQDFSFPMPIAGRIVLFQATLVTSGTLAVRYPYFQFMVGGAAYRFLMSNIAVHRYQTWIFTGGPGIVKPYTRTADQVVTFGFPDVFLPAGSNVSSYTGNMDPSDQWYNIVMCMSAN
jgi:hypothetical protein